MKVTIKAPRGNKLSCMDWPQEAAMRMLMNNLDNEVAENPSELIVYGGSGRAARNWEAYYKIIEALTKLKNDETLLIQSGKPVAVFRTFELSPRVLIVNSMLVPRWATWEYFRELEAKGLIMYGQMTAGSWIYIGTQGIIQGTYETFAALAEKHFNSTLKNKLVLTAGLGGMGGAQPLAIKFNEGVALIAEVDYNRIKRRLETGYLDMVIDNMDQAIKMALEYKNEGKAVSIAIPVNAATLYTYMLKNDIIPDVVTDQTSAHDELNGYIPEMDFEQALKLRNFK